MFCIAPVCPSPCQLTRNSSACAASGARGSKGWTGSRRPWGHKYKQGKNSNPTDLRHSSAALSCPVLGFPRQPAPHGSRSSTFLQLRSLRRDISHNNLLETPAGTTLPGSETSKHPQLPTLSPSRLRKARAPWKWGEQLSPSPWGRPPWPPPTSRVQQQVPGVEVPAQDALLVKPL